MMGDITRAELEAVEQALDLGLDEARSKRLFTAFGRALKRDDKAINVAWALAQLVSGLLFEAPDRSRRPEMVRHFLAMVEIATKARDGGQGSVH